MGSGRLAELHPSNPDYLEFSQKAAYYHDAKLWFMFPLPAMASSAYSLDSALPTHS